MNDLGSERILGSTGSALYDPFPSFVDWWNRPFDSTVVDRYEQLLQDSKEDASDEDLRAAVEIATRYAAVDTGAIEGLYTVDRGFTRTIATQAAAWEATLDSRGEGVRQAIQSALSAYEFVLDASTRAVSTSEVWIRELHALVCASQETYTVYTSEGPQERPLFKGTYKTMPNSPTNESTGKVHAYAPVLDTAPEMARLVAELRSEAFEAAHPVVQAAYAHYAYVCVHPFPDGNGRVARALASVYLYRSPGVPLVIFADQRNEYLDTLEAADAGNPEPFVTFLEQRTVDAIGIIRATLNRTVFSGEALATVSAFFSSGGLNKELLAAVERLRKILLAELRQQITALNLPPQLEIDPIAMGPLNLPVKAGYLSVGSPGDILVRAHSAWPANLEIRQEIVILARMDAAAPSDLICVSRTGYELEVWLRELVPSESSSLRIRLRTWVQHELDTLIDTIRTHIVDSAE